MTEEKRKAKARKGVSRREFIAGTVGGVVVGAVVGAAAGSLGFPKTVTKMETETQTQTQTQTQTLTQTTTSVTTAQPWLPAKWDYETDVIVVGLGGAGAQAALCASQAGAKVIVLEKAPQGQEGGSTGTCGDGSNTYKTVQDATSYLQALCFGTTPDDVIDVMAQHLQTDNFIADMKAEGFNFALSTGTMFTTPEFSTLPGGSGTAGDVSVVWTGDPSFQGGGRQLFATLENAIQKEGVNIMYATPATHLIQDAVTKEILGVQATSGTNTINIQSHKAVIMTCGGFENNYEMQGYFLFPGLPKIYPIGCLYSTGDGIEMATEVGAALWHTASFEWAPLGIAKASEQLGCSVTYSTAAFGPYIFVNKYGNRFMNETTGLTYWKGTLPLTYFDQAKAEYPNVPNWLICTGLTGTLGTGVWGAYQTWYMVHSGYTWSKDNSTEIANGWIVQANTIADLASSLSVDPVGLQATVTKYNQYCAAGTGDPDFGRASSTMKPLVTPPYYAFEQNLSFVKTEGGPQRNANAQILNEGGNPIPRLYSAGEFGSVWGALCPHGLSVGECLIFGRVAGQNAAAETSLP